MNVCTCPGPQLLRDYAEGRLDQPQHDGIEAHLDDCADCLRAVEALDRQGQTPFPHLHCTTVPALPFEEDDFQHLVARAKALTPAEELPALADEGALARALEERGYQLLGPLGAGGMGRVYKAEHRRMKRTVAVKVLSPELLRSPAARARFASEVEAIARLASPNIVAAFDAGEAAGRDFLVMEYVEGRNLAEVVKAQGPLPVERALAHVLQAARGLQQAHAAGIVHRDVKPANLLLDRRDTVKLLDLGLAHLADEGLVTAGAVMGTAAFMAPEQATEGGRVDGRADVYGLGCTLYFLLTGRPPYERETVRETLLAHRTCPIPALPAPCPAPLGDLFRRMVAKGPEDRPALGAVVAGLERLLAPAPRRTARRLAALAAMLALCGSLLWAAFPRSETGPAPLDKGETARKVGPAPPSLAAPAPPAPGKRATPAIEMVSIPAGSFWRGSPDSDPDKRENERPRKEIKVRRAFSLGKFEITQAQYQEVMGHNPSAFGPNHRFKGKKIDTRNHPVESVSWLDAVRFCNKLSERHGLKPYYRIEGTTMSVVPGTYVRTKVTTVTIVRGNGYRLPTEAEWEHACRAESTTRWSFGDAAKDLGAHAWFDGNAGGLTHAVGQKKPNAWGLYDMHGNVPEWCWDRYSATAYKGSRVSDPTGPGEGRTRVFRGGGWDHSAAGTRSAARTPLGLAYSGSTLVGIRVARDEP